MRTPFLRLTALAGAEHVEQILEEFGDEARQAMVSGEEWDWEPEWMGEDSWWAHRSDSEEYPWYAVAYRTGYTVQDKTLYHDMFSNDTNGNFDYAESYQVADPAYPANWEREYGHKAWCANQVQYARWVMEHGKDPLQFYSSLQAVKRIGGRLHVHCPGAEDTIRRYGEGGTC